MRAMLGKVTEGWDRAEGSGVSGPGASGSLQGLDKEACCAAL